MSLNLTNAEADHLARHTEDAALALRELAAHHARHQDAMTVIGERLMAWYHEAKHEATLELIAQLEQDAADLRARRKPLTATRPSGLPPARTINSVREPPTDAQHRAAIREDTTHH